MDDIEKYAKVGNAAVLRHCLESSPFEAGTRIKFEGFGRSNYKSHQVSESLKLTQQAMLIDLLYPTTQLRPPIVPDRKKSPRLQLMDTGLLNFLLNIQETFFQYDDLHGFYKGIIAEHIVGQEIKAILQLNQSPTFWVREKKQSTAETDFVLARHGRLYPVEVKAGTSGRLRSLHQFMDGADHGYAIRLSSQSLSIQDAHTISGKPFKLLNLPYYLASKILDYID